MRHARFSRFEFAQPVGLRVESGLLDGTLLVMVFLAPLALLAADSPSARHTARGNEAIRKALAAKVDIDVLNQPIRDFIAQVAKRIGGPVVLGKAGLRRAEVDPTLEITASFKQVPLGTALRQILRPLKLQHRVVDGALVIDDVGEQPDELAQRAAIVRARNVAERRAREQALRFNWQKVKGLDAFIDVKVMTPLFYVRPLLQRELDFVSRTCQPTPRQLDQLQDAAWKQIGDALADWQTDNGTPAPSYSREIVQDEVRNAVRTTLSPVQIARYEAEVTSRKVFRNLACARSLLVTLDGELFLTTRQRDELCADLAQNWDEAWTATIALTSTNDGGVIPAVPDELILPHLDPLQRLLWRRLPKTGKINWPLDQTAFLGLLPLDKAE